MRFDKYGVVLADVAPSGVVKRDANAASGNPNHDTRSGKFGSGGSKKPNVATPANTDALEFSRLLDAARDAARLFDNPDTERIQEFLAGRAKNPEAVDVNKFLILVKEWKKNDLVDVLDQQMSKSKADVKVTADSKFIRASLNGLDKSAQAEVLHRLEARGHNRKEIDKFFGRRVDVSEDALKERDALAASDQWLAT